MEKNKKCKNKFIENTICSLYEAEDFLCKYNKFTDILKIIKIVKRQKNN